MKFIDQRTGETKEAVSLTSKDGKVYIQFEEGGKVYGYKESNIKVLTDAKHTHENKLIVYAYKRKCYKCEKETEVLTYVVYRDSKNENLIYPWNKDRLNIDKSWEETLAHITYEEIEFYPIKVIGSDPNLDEILRSNYPDRILKKYSKTQKRNYPMNVCQHCGAKQGEFFIYSEVNKKIQRMEQMDIVDIIDLE